MVEGAVPDFGKGGRSEGDDDIEGATVGGVVADELLIVDVRGDDGGDLGGSLAEIVDDRGIIVIGERDFGVVTGGTEEGFVLLENVLERFTFGADEGVSVLDVFSTEPSNCEIFGKEEYFDFELWFCG